MGVLDGKAAIVTGSAAASAARRPSCSPSSARILINDLDGDVAEQAASEIQGDTAVFAGDLRRRGWRPARAEGGRRVRPARHGREQRRLHVGRPDRTRWPTTSSRR